MSYTRLVRQFQSIRSRQLHSTFIKYEEKNVPEPKPLKPEKLSENIFGAPLHTVTNFDKRILVWVKRYPSLDQVPEKVTLECIKRAHTMARIRACFWMMGFAVVGILYSVISGKREKASGRDILKERLQYLTELREQGKKEEVEKANSGKQ